MLNEADCSAPSTPLELFPIALTLVVPTGAGALIRGPPVGPLSLGPCDGWGPLLPMNIRSWFQSPPITGALPRSPPASLSCPCSSCAGGRADADGTGAPAPASRASRPACHELSAVYVRPAMLAWIAALSLTK